MAVADGSGAVTVFVVSAHPTDPSANRVSMYQFPATVTIKGAASIVAAANGLSTASLTLVAQQQSGALVAIEAPTVTFASGTSIANGARVILVPGT